MVYLLLALLWPVGDGDIGLYRGIAARIEHGLSHAADPVLLIGVAANFLPVNIFELFGVEDVLAYKFHFDCCSQVFAEQGLSHEELEPILPINTMPES